jgi:hypothetical protein
MLWEPELERLNNGRFYWLAAIVMVAAGALA